MENEYKRCKECGRPLPRGRSPISQTARELGYCRYCFRMNVSDAPDRRKREYSPDENLLVRTQGADVFDPARPWDWYEYFFPEKER